MQTIAILYQAQQPPEYNGIKKPMKEGGYSDSGADIAYALRQGNQPIITPVETPDIYNDYEWVFPDTLEGISDAYERGVRIFWLNTVLFKTHPITKFFDKGIDIVGQQPNSVEIYDDKWETNNFLKKKGIRFPHSTLILKDETINFSKGYFPMVLKPLRGRGSQGVSIVKSNYELQEKINALLKQKTYGTHFYVEKFLVGKEITITVMPPGKYHFEDNTKKIDKFWCLPVVERFNHQNGIAPYSGVIAVMKNSKVMTESERLNAEIHNVIQECEKAAGLLKMKAPIRIDCRADEHGKFHLFDINLKPNMTGNCRPHRKDQSSLTALAAESIGWDYKSLVANCLFQK